MRRFALFTAFVTLFSFAFVACGSKTKQTEVAKGDVSEGIADVNSDTQPVTTSTDAPDVVK
jgi:hypothetical protein